MTHSKARLLDPEPMRSGLTYGVLQAAYDELCAIYTEHGMPQQVLNALVKAKRYLARWPAPYQRDAVTWFVGDGEANSAAQKRGGQLIGYDCIPMRNMCACRTCHDWKRGRELVTCVEIQIVILYLKAISYDNDIQRHDYAQPRDEADRLSERRDRAARSY